MIVSRYLAAGKCFQNTTYPAGQNYSRISTEKLIGPIFLKTVDLCVEMSSDFNYNFGFVVEEIFELGMISTKLEV